MAFNLPFLSKNKKEEQTGQEDDIAQQSALEEQPDRSAQDMFQQGDRGSSQERILIDPNATIIDPLRAREGLRLPLIGNLPLRRQINILMIVLMASLALSMFLVALNTHLSTINVSRTQIAGHALMHSQRVGKAAPNAIQGNLEAFKQLEDSRQQLNNDLKVLAEGGVYQGRDIPAAEGELAAMLKETADLWAASNQSAATILRFREQLSGFGATLQELNETTPVLLELSEQIATLKAQANASAREIAAAGQLAMLTQRLGRGANEFLTSEGVNPETAFLLGKDTNAFRDIIEGLLNGSEALRLPATTDKDTRDRLTELQTLFTDYQKPIAEILGGLQNFIAAKRAEHTIFNENEAFKEKLTQLEQAYQEAGDTKSWPFWALVFFALLALMSAGGIAVAFLQDSRNRTREADLRREAAEGQRQMAQSQEEEAKAANDRNQAAILRLMNELQEVADGDLTVQATVSEDITGAIADSLNYTVEELRVLVGRVTETAEQVTRASDQAQNISTELLAASQEQSREIQETGQAVLKMAVQITEVSRSANESAEVARQSVTVASQGAKAVENAIKGMNEIREQIQETSKRIKRLGESSQEIGEITELISDITEQTNVLALNAAIQAASAGEAGRGFSVVAEEVQRLAERSGEATKQIGALVRTIQTDTHDAVAAMERSTQGVVEGAKLSDAAGAALTDIQRVSNQLAELIQGISSATEQQASSANGVAENIQHILEVTEQTQQGTQQTANSIRELSKLAEELKDSVARFRVA